MTYNTDPAREQILKQAAYIRDEQQAPLEAGRWLQRVLNAGSSLKKLPHRCERAEEDAYCSYEVRIRRMDSYGLLFTIVEETKTVWVIGTRGGGQLPRVEDLATDFKTDDE